MMKICILAACVAATMGVSHEATPTEAPAISMNDGDVDMFSPKTGAFERDRKYDLDKDEMIEEAEANFAAANKAKADIAKMAETVAAQKGRIDAAAADAKALADGGMAKATGEAQDEVKSKFAATGAINKAIEGNGFAALVAAEKAELKAYLEAQFKAMTIPSSVLSSSTSTALNGAKAAQAALKKEHVALAAELAAHEACAVDGEMYDIATKKCKPLTAPAEKFINKVYHRMFTNADGRDSGYVTNRYVVFKKAQDDTYIRMFYYDNLRVHGHTSHAIWNVMVCDEKGNGCAHCNDPGRLNLNKWSGHQHNWWMIDYMAHTLMGLCKRSDNRALKKGTYQFKVMISNNRYDIYTGHNQHSSFTVDEVVKY